MTTTTTRYGAFLEHRALRVKTLKQEAGELESVCSYFAAELPTHYSYRIHSGVRTDHVLT
jgi:hypothetical protein